MVNRCGVGAAIARCRALIVIVLLLAGAGILLRTDVSSHALSGHDLSPNDQSHPQQNISSSSPAQIQATFGRLPMSFEPNRGQADGSVKFLARGNGYGLYLTSTEAALVFRSSN